MAGKKKEKLSADFDDLLIEQLKDDPELICEYLNAAIADGDSRVFLMALGNIAKAIGMSKAAASAALNREHIYHAISGAGNPLFSSVSSLLEAVGVMIATKPVQPRKKITVSKNMAWA